MANTTYNVIDTLAHAFGQQKMESIFKHVVGFIEKLPDDAMPWDVQQLVLHDMAMHVPELDGASHPVRYTMFDCIRFSVTEGLSGNMAYGFGHYSPTTQFLSKLQ